MKFGFIFSICALLLIYFQLSAAVICRDNPVERECSSCVIYRCDDNESGPEIRGCPDDFFSNCSKHAEFIKSKNYNDMELLDPKKKVLYISGCGNEKDGTICMRHKSARAFGGQGSHAYCFEGGKPCIIPDDSGSNNQNGALKLIGILTFGWLLSTAAWNLY